MKRLLIVILCLALAGCATTGNTKKKSGKTGTSEVSNSVKSLDDDRALELGAIIYNTPVDNRADEIAKGITLKEYLKAMKKRRSKKIKESGILDLEYEQIDMQGWTYKEMQDYYRMMELKSVGHEGKPVAEMTDDEKGIRIIRLTAMATVIKEAKKKRMMEETWSVLGQILGAALTVAIAAI